MVCAVLAEFYRSIADDVEDEIRLFVEIFNAQIEEISRPNGVLLHYLESLQYDVVFYSTQKSILFSAITAMILSRRRRINW